MTTEQERAIERKLDQLVRLLAVNITRGLPRAADQITVLDRAGLSVREIAEVLDMRPNTVSVTLYQLRKKRANG
jgi:DNA-binding NarL/FixJ family response regulator